MRTMAKAVFVQKGENIDYTATGDIEYMEIVPLVSRVGVALEAIADGKTGTVSLTGVYEMPAATSLAINVGDEVYWDNVNNVINKTKTGNIPAGIAVAEKAAAGTSVLVRIG